ncbi:putative amidohydrolase YtcJ [Arthrobacter sp. Hiyo8]|nr:putative amidohydrolase YtcJ [Arthrobacter sp. Hiyo8]
MDGTSQTGDRRRRGNSLPGLIDAHIHPIHGAEIARGLDLGGITELDDIRAALVRYAASTPHAAGSDWLFAWGLDPVIFGDTGFNNSLFDGILDDELVFITLFDGHASLVSDAALKLAGVTGAEKLPSTGYVGVDQLGKPNGMLYEMAAQELVRGVLPELSFEQRVDGLEKLLRSMAESGLVAGQMLDFGAQTPWRCWRPWSAEASSPSGCGSPRGSCRRHGGRPEGHARDAGQARKALARSRHQAHDGWNHRQRHGVAL